MAQLASKPGGGLLTPASIIAAGPTHSFVIASSTRRRPPCPLGSGVVRREERTRRRDRAEAEPIPAATSSSSVTAAPGLRRPATRARPPLPQVVATARGCFLPF
ncbi:hypothetical protein ABZP36_019303 [Zizania latifolia]